MLAGAADFSNTAPKPASDGETKNAEDDDSGA